MITSAGRAEGRLRYTGDTEGVPRLADPLHDPDPRTVAEHAHGEALLRCWLRETRTPVELGPLRVDLPTTGMSLCAEVLHCSATGWHRFGPLRIEGPAGPVGSPADPVLAVALVAAELAARGGARTGGVPDGEAADLVERAAESVRRVATFVRHRAEQPDPPPGVDGFLDAEQALLLGHLHHPAPKSRDGISDADAAVFSPELRGSFGLHWFAADPTVVSSDALATSPALAGRDATALLADLAGDPLGDADGRVLVPVHPWQARDVLHRPRVAALIARGLLEPLGERGPRWWPTSSVRTVYRPDADVMLKLSLGVRITNSRREFTRTELLRGLEICRLLEAGYAEQTFAAHPRFDITRDPAWLAVDEPARPGGPELMGLDVAVREMPRGIDGLRCLAGLVAPRPGQGRSRLGEIVAEFADPAQWVAGYTEAVLLPMLHLYAATGIGLEAHQQNTLVRIRAGGSVVGGAFRDNQGYYLAASRLPSVLRVLGSDCSTLAVVDDDIVDERLTYYLLHNQAFAVIGCLAVDGIAEEADLLAVMAQRLRAALPDLAEAGPDGDRLVRRWLSAETLPCKANLLTRLHGIDEVVAPLDAQSVYLSTRNPFAARGTAVAAHATC